MDFMADRVCRYRNSAGKTDPKMPELWYNCKQKQWKCTETNDENKCLQFPNEGKTDNHETESNRTGSR